MHILILHLLALFFVGGLYANISFGAFLLTLQTLFVQQMNNCLMVCVYFS